VPIPVERARRAFRRVDRDLVRLAAESRPENIHDFRTSTRRLQTLLESLSRQRNRNQKKLLKLLDSIRRRAGKVRNFDVQLAALRSLKVAQEPRRKTQLMQELLDLRAKPERKLRRMLTKQTVREIRERLNRASGDVPSKAQRDPLSVARDLLAQALRPAGAMTEKSLHDRRILIKRARYAAEFAPKTAEATQLISRLKRMQDAIGNWHDWQSLANSAAGHLGDIHQSSLLAELRNVTGSKFRGAVAALSASAAVSVRSKLPRPSSVPEHKREATVALTPERANPAA